MSEVCKDHANGNGYYIDADCYICNRIADQQARIDELEAQSQWISVEDELPPEQTPVLVRLNSQTLYEIAERRWERPTYEETFTAFWYWDNPSNDGQDWGEYVTHWMPFPSPPKTDS